MTFTNVRKEQVWAVLTDVNHWSDWDKDIQWAELKGKAQLDANFFLKPKGGPKTKLTITQFDPPNVFADISHLPLAKMHTVHTFTESKEGLTVLVEIKVTGLFSFLWSRVIAQKQIDGGPNQTHQLITKARAI